MRRLTLSLALALLAASAASAQAYPQQGLEHILREPNPVRRNEVLVERGRLQLDELSHVGHASRGAGARTFKASVVVTNQSLKTVKAVFWTVSLLEPGSGATIRRYDVATEGLIAPGKRKRLTRRLPVPPVRSLSAHSLGNSPAPVADVVTAVTRIEYADGSFTDSP